jgi:hypothetical protein
MVSSITNLYQLPVGMILIWAGIWKVFFANSSEIIAQSALALLFRRERTVHFIYQNLGLFELILGWLLILYHQRTVGRPG